MVALISKLPSIFMEFKLKSRKEGSGGTKTLTLELVTIHHVHSNLVKMMTTEKTFYFLTPAIILRPPRGVCEGQPPPGGRKMSEY